ncbi:tyrosine--tRNA ligase [Candidatus Palauibacter sp.]|uniref:tyrosine--tRNA ligase n=1 Tax=Candidatus Palauibacter sp. TaxID=3101350 RepID=UPI003CC66C92
MFLPVAEQLDRIRQGAERIVPEAELLAKLERSAREERPLIIKQGFDPTRPDLHIGHGVSIHKLRTFQELGHRVVFVMGDFTARVGDPSGRDETRPMLSGEEIESNLATYEKQLFRILDPETTEIRRNSEWLARLTLADILRLTSQYTVARMLERDDFAERHREGRPISLVEFLYPMMQGYDSVALRADVELGGTDQLFNLLLGRTLQERAGQEPQVCLIMPLLRGTDGRRKMSKSYDNYIGISMEAEDAFGRVMSIPDTLLEEWLSLASSARGEELARRRREAGTDPLATKRWLAGDIVARYHGTAAARRARGAFDRLHRHRKMPEDIPTVALSLEGRDGLWIAHVLRDSHLASSSSEAGRLIRQGAVRVDGDVIADRDLRLGAGEYVVQRGKRKFARISVGP